MPGPRISVVIPTHNGSKRLGNCLDAIRRALGPGDEIIVVDDASQDGSAEVARSFGASVFSLEKNGGAAKARNFGAGQATGEIIFFTDDDVVIPKNAISQLRSHFTEEQVAGVVGVLDEQIPYSDFASNLKNLWMRFSYLKCPPERVGLFYTSVAAIRKSVFVEVGGFNENYLGASVEDTDFGQQVWQKGFLIRIDPTLTVSHHKHYSLGGVLRTDFQRAQALTLLRFRKSGQKFFTSVPFAFQISVPILALAAVFLLSATFYVEMLYGSALLSLLYYLLIAPWLLFLFQTRGLGFGLVATVFQPLDTLVVGLGMTWACLRHFTGKRF